MTVFRKRAPFVRGVALALFVLYLPACTTWRRQSFPAQAVILDTHPKSEAEKVLLLAESFGGRCAALLIEKL